MKTSSFAVSLLLAGSATGFAPALNTGRTAAVELSAVDRRQFVSVAAASAALLIGTQPALADVSDGTALPEGAAQFSRLIKVQADIPGVKKRLSEANSDDIDKKEWTNIGSFLRRIYAEGDDMKSIGSGLSPDKKKQGEEIVDQLRKYTKAGESSINAQDTKACTSILDKSNALIGDFLDLLSDVPDEI